MNEAWGMPCECLGRIRRQASAGTDCWRLDQKPSGQQSEADAPSSTHVSRKASATRHAVTLISPVTGHISNTALPGKKKRLFALRIRPAPSQHPPCLDAQSRQTSSLLDARSFAGLDICSPRCLYESERLRRGSLMLSLPIPDHRSSALTRST